jgi:uncharacterized membrane protein YccC
METRKFIINRFSNSCFLYSRKKGACYLIKNCNLMDKKTSDLLLFVLVCLAGTVIGFFLYRVSPVLGQWCLFSILLVLAPDRKDVMPLAMNRIKANLVGAAVGLILFAIYPVNLLIICLGITTSIVICEIFQLQAATRSASIAVLIVTLHEPGQHIWDVALERAGGTLLGCIIGIGLSYLMHITLIQSKRAIYRIKK